MPFPAKQLTTALAKTSVRRLILRLSGHCLLSLRKPPSFYCLDRLLKSGSINSQRDYFRQDQEEVLSTPIEIARKLPDDILKLAGYCKTNL